MLTERQRQIVEFLRVSDETPSVAEIRIHLGLQSDATVAQHLDALESKGVIRREPGRMRNIRLLGAWRPKAVRTIPLLGTIPAGAPVDTEEQSGDCLALDAETLRLNDHARTFALKVRGDSMIGAGIQDGDIAILEVREPVHRDIVAALIDGETTLKRFLVQRDKPFLRAENPNYPDLLPARELVIQGVFHALISTARR